jgi:lysophospholipase L1-like esterase
VFSFGVNDTTLEDGKTRVGFSSSLENTYNILNAAQQLFPVLMVGPPPVADAEQNLRILRLSQEKALVCRSLNVPYLEIYTELQKSDIWMNETAAFDGSHPSAAGYSELTRLVQAWSAWSSWFKKIEDFRKV